MYLVSNTFQRHEFTQSSDIAECKGKISWYAFPHHIFPLYSYPFLIGQSSSSVPVVHMAAITDPSATASTSSIQPPPISRKKRKKQHPPLPAKASKLRKSDYDADVDETNDAAEEGINNFDLGIIPEECIPQTESSHTERRRRNANAWQQLMPSLIHPLMASLHSIAPNNSTVDEPFTCVSGCEIQRSTVKSVSFGGMHILFFLHSDC
jgi:hypothetical protein